MPGSMWSVGHARPRRCGAVEAGDRRRGKQSVWRRGSAINPLVALGFGRAGILAAEDEVHLYMREGIDGVWGGNTIVVKRLLKC